MKNAIGPSLLCALVLTTLWAPAIKRTPPTTELLWCPFGMVLPWFCADLTNPKPAPCPPPKIVFPLQPAHETVEAR